MFFRQHSGMLYRDFIAKVIEAKKSKLYLEIGVRNGHTLSMSMCDSIGVDPNFDLTMNVMGSKKSVFLFQETSDEFFRERDVSAMFGRKVDVAFLDGLHQFEYLLRDFINCEKLCNPNSVIILDDCLPLTSEMTERVYQPEGRKHEATQYYWTGDVWKVVPILKKYRPDLRMTLVDTQPTGSVCITNLDPASRNLEGNYYQILDEYIDVSMNDKKLSEYYSKNKITSSQEVLTNFNASRFIGP